jgi:recombination associated protein RdgC
MFRSVRFYSVASPWPDSEQDLSAKLAGAAFKPCGPYMERSTGFEAPIAEELGLARRVAGADLLQLRSQVRLLPAAALNEVLETRLAEYRARMQQEPGRRTKRQLKEQTRDELLPKALLKSERTTALYLSTERVLAVGSASATRAERFLETLRFAFGKLEVTPLELDRPFGELLARTFTGDGPRELVLARECRMRDIKDAKSTVRWQNVDLAHSTVQRCLRDGMELTHLAFEFDNVMSGVLDANGVLTKLALADVEEAPEGDGDDPLAKRDAEIALFGGALRELLRSLGRALGGKTLDDAVRPVARIVGTSEAPTALAAADPLLEVGAELDGMAPEMSAALPAGT